MATKVLMEALSPTMEEGRLVEWKKKEGDTVSPGDILAEVETDKAVMDLVARTGGVLLKQLVTPGTTVPVSHLIGVIGDAGEDIGALTAMAGKAETTGVADKTAEPAPRAAASGGSTSSATTVSPAPSARIKASPLARKVAMDRGLDLRAIHGSGPDGRIVARDIEATGAAVGAPAGATRSAQPSPGPSGQAFTDLPISQIRKTIAKRLALSLGPIPTFYLTTEADMERTWEAREGLLEVQRGRGAEGQVKVSFNDIIIKAAATALRQHPACNAWWLEDRIRQWRDIHIGMAVAVEDGLITPVIRYADLKTLREIAAESRDLAARARDRRLTPEDYTGGTFSVSNLGMFDIDQFTAVINPPEAGILAVGSITPKPVAVGSQIVLRRRMRVTLSCDHRVIDGATGAAFLQTLKAILENPLAMVW